MHWSSATQGTCGRVELLTLSEPPGLQQYSEHGKKEGGCGNGMS